jgi:hypothetical protein
MNLVATLHKIGDPILSYGTTSIGNKTDSHAIHLNSVGGWVILQRDDTSET